jgi:hypothetical protein
MIYIPFIIAYVCLTIYYCFVILQPGSLFTKGMGVFTTVISIGLYVASGVYAAYMHMMDVLDGSFGTWSFILYLVCFALDAATYFLMLSLLMTYSAMCRQERMPRYVGARRNALYDEAYGDESYDETYGDESYDDGTYDDRAYNNRAYNDEASDGRISNNGAADGGAYNNRTTDGGAYNNGATDGGAYNSGTTDGGAYNNRTTDGGAYNNGATDDRIYNNGARHGGTKEAANPKGQLDGDGMTKASKSERSTDTKRRMKQVFDHSAYEDEAEAARMQKEYYGGAEDMTAKRASAGNAKDSGGTNAGGNARSGGNTNVAESGKSGGNANAGGSAKTQSGKGKPGPKKRR